MMKDGSLDSRVEDPRHVKMNLRCWVVSVGEKSLKDEKWRDACTWIVWVGSVETLGPAGGENLTGTGKVGKWETGQMIWNPKGVGTNTTGLGWNGKRYGRGRKRKCVRSDADSLQGWKRRRADGAADIKVVHPVKAQIQ